MASVRTFRGILYNSEKVKRLGDVVTPPYDVISEEERRHYVERHPNNVVRLILSPGRPDDTDRDNRYTRAATYFFSWLESGVLRRDLRPAFYITEMDFKNEGRIRTRLGLIALVRLENFGKGGILPHEKTFSATKADRFRLMQACHANFSPIFSLFPDPDERVARALRSGIEGQAPDLDFKEAVGYRHRLWRVTDPELQGQISRGLAQHPLFIADGHHRYETALNFRDDMARRLGTRDPEASYHYVMMYLCSLKDPGLVMRSVHRLLRRLPREAMEHFVDRAGRFFDIESLETESEDPSMARRAFLKKIHAGVGQGVIGAVIRGHRILYVLHVKPGVMDGVFNGRIPAALRQLDVTVATRLILQRTLGFDEAALDDETRISYTSRTPKAFEAVDAGRCDMALILNPTRLSHVEEVSRAGLIMPRKSTYFFPKVLSGLVINKIDSDTL
ncbi:MAG: DUF1015 domain-containing protein [Deltaproteobacteria bacterium]|nr:DUF1015 domain-containing protein [Deltaproteobacteria bacterium]